MLDPILLSKTRRPNLSDFWSFFADILGSAPEKNEAQQMASEAASRAREAGKKEEAMVYRPANISKSGKSYGNAMSFFCGFVI